MYLGGLPNAALFLDAEPPGSEPPPPMLDMWPVMLAWKPTPPPLKTNTCENITLRQTSFVGFNNDNLSWSMDFFTIFHLPEI